jgi:hypothetical protein
VPNHATVRDHAVHWLHPTPEAKHDTAG